MNKQKYIVMVLTFIVLILITPFIFSKLMNSKFDEMLLNLQQQEGLKIKEIRDKSSYLKTDRIFLVDIPGEKINNNFIKNLEFKIETIFYNLPVTKVDFKGVLKNISLTQKEYDNKINTLLADKIKFVAITPNFKIYNYKVEDINIPIQNILLKIKGIKGTCENSDIKSNKMTINDISFIADNLLFEIKNLEDDSLYKKNILENKNSFDLYLKIQNNNVQVNNIKIYTNTQIDKKTNVIFKISFDKFINQLFNVDNFIFNLNVLNLDTATLVSMAKEIDPQNKDNLTFELLKKGLEIKLNSKVKDINAMNENLGFYLINGDLKILPDANLQSDIQTDDLKFLNSHIYFESSPELATLFMNLFPQSSFIFALAKKEGGKIILDISLKNSKLFVNGEEIK